MIHFRHSYSCLCFILLIALFTIIAPSEIANAAGNPPPSPSSAMIGKYPKVTTPIRKSLPGNSMATAAIGPAGVIQIQGNYPALAANQKKKSPMYGINYWCWSTTLVNDIPGTEQRMRELGINIVRAGGWNNDSNYCGTAYEPFDRNQIDIFVRYCRAIGAEPLLQVPILKSYTQNRPATPQDAADMVAYCNITKRYNIKYWSIGNEPDVYEGRDRTSYKIDDYCRDFHNFSQAMKAVDPTIKIMGADLSWKYYPNVGSNDWLTPFLTRCRGDFDIMSIHYYPYINEQCTFQNAMNENIRFRDWLHHIRAIMNNAGLANIPIAITESDITWDGDPAHTTYPASPQTYFAGMWNADNIGVALEENVWTVDYWSLCETWDHAFLKGDTKVPLPRYYALQMFSNHFGPTILHPVQPLPSMFSVYASRNTQNNRTILIVLNKNGTTNHETIQFSRFQRNLANREYDFPPYSITCLSIPDDGGTMQIWSYTKDLADRNLPPVQIQ